MEHGSTAALLGISGLGPGHVMGSAEEGLERPEEHEEKRWESLGFEGSARNNGVGQDAEASVAKRAQRSQGPRDGTSR